MNAFGLSRLVVLFFLSQSCIMSALLSSLSPSQSHIHYVRRMSLNSNQGKIIPSVVLFLKNFKLRLNHFARKMTKLLLLVHSLLQYQVLIGQSPLFSSEMIISREFLTFHVHYKFYVIHKINNPKGMVRGDGGFTEGMLFVMLYI